MQRKYQVVLHVVEEKISNSYAIYANSIMQPTCTTYYMHSAFECVCGWLCSDLHIAKMTMTTIRTFAMRVMSAILLLILLLLSAFI